MPAMSPCRREEYRLALQEKLDAGKTQAERNRMGQFATPTRLAMDILHYARNHLGSDNQVRFIDPAIGTGSFYSALLAVFPEARIDAASGYEIDPHYGEPADCFWRDAGLDLHLEDFTQADTPPESGKFNLLICNPPYVRHHHIGNEAKKRLKAHVIESCDVEINGLAGLYCYFLGLSHAWMQAGGLAGWLIPSEFMDVNYGASIKSYLLEKVTLLHIHRFDPNDVQFGDALVSSAVVWFRKAVPPSGHAVRFTYGGSLNQPVQERLVPVDTLRRHSKWTRFPMSSGSKDEDSPILGDFFRIKRGLATGDNSYFILPAEEIERRGLPYAAFRPILPSPRYLPENEVDADDKGNPVLNHRLFLLDCYLPEDEIKERYPSLSAYLEEGKAKGIAERYICRHRTLWYTQEKRPPAPFVCTYFGRKNNKSGRPFRFILNNSLATAANVYLMLYPKDPVAQTLASNPSLRRALWKFLNTINPEVLLDEGRVYGGGLHKLEPKELSNVSVSRISELLPEKTASQSII